MAKIELIRSVRREAYCDGDNVRIVETVNGVCVKFEDNDGVEVSLAFDGRADKDDGYEVYGLYRDCPVMLVNRSFGPQSDLLALRTLRDALKAMALGD